MQWIRWLIPECFSVLQGDLIPRPAYGGLKLRPHSVGAMDVLKRNGRACRASPCAAWCHLTLPITFFLRELHRSLISTPSASIPLCYVSSAVSHMPVTVEGSDKKQGILFYSKLLERISAFKVIFRHVSQMPQSFSGSEFRPVARICSPTSRHIASPRRLIVIIICRVKRHVERGVKETLMSAL